MKYRNASALLILGLWFSTASAHAQQPAPESETLSATTELVLVPAQVKGRDGKPVLGLKQDDFVLRSDGKQEPIRVFEETDKTNPNTAPRAATPTPANMVLSVPNDGMPDQILILALDLVNTAFLDQTRAKRELLSYLSEQLPNQHFALVAITKDGLQQIHNFSSDPAVLVEALRLMQNSTEKDVSEQPLLDSIASTSQFANPSQPQAEYQSMLNAFNEAQIYSSYRQKIAAGATLMAFVQIAQAYAGVPGRKSVIWITDGMPTLLYDAFAGGIKNGSALSIKGSALNGDSDLLYEYDQAFVALNNANIAVYGVDLKGIKSDRKYQGTGFDQATAIDDTRTKGLTDRRGLSGNSMMVSPSDYQDDAIKVVSAGTGGKSCTANTGLKECIDEAVADSASYYMLGFYVPQQERKPGWHKLEVKLVNERGSVRSRTSYYLAPTTALSEKDVNRALRDAATAKIDYTGITFGVQPQSSGEAAKTGVPPMRIIVPAGSVLLAPGQPQLSYDIVSVPLNSEGEPAANLRVVHLNLNAEQTQTALSKGWAFTDQPQASGSQVLKYVLRDNGSGRIGSVIVSLSQKTGG